MEQKAGGGQPASSAAISTLDAVSGEPEGVSRKCGKLIVHSLSDGKSQHQSVETRELWQGVESPCEFPVVCLNHAAVENHR